MDRIESSLHVASTGAPGRRTALVLEALGLFFIPPTLLAGARLLGVPVPVVPLILVATVCLAILLARDRSFDRGALLRRASPGEVARVVVIFVPLALLLVLYVQIVEPERWLAFPRRSPRMWVAVMLLYPLLSVYPQELVFRGFFFHRYRLLHSSRPFLIATSAAAFGYAHVFFGHPISIVLTAVGGVLFAWTYARTRSLLLVSFEHALYGCLLFTIGMGRYFYSPV